MFQLKPTAAATALTLVFSRQIGDLTIDVITQVYVVETGAAG